MDLSIVQPRSRWAALLWKEYQQIKPVVVAVTVGHLSIQSLLAIWALTGDISLQAFRLESIPIWTLVGPILVAIGCAGMLVGQERQSNTWNWQSSLPIDWKESLVSKLLVTLFASIATAAFLAIIPAILMATGSLSLFGTPDAIDQFNSITLSGGIGFIQVVAICFLTSLLMREPINALASAGIFLVVGQWLLAGVLFGLIFQLHAAEASIATILFAMSIFVFGFLGMVLAYRWRWGRGQLAELRLGARSTVPTPAVSRLQYSHGKAPSAWNMLLYHSWQNSLALRSVGLLGSLLFVAGTASTTLSDLSSMLILLVVFLSGLSAFEGDRSLGRFRFLADRGVSPTMLVSSRLAVVIALVVLFLLACSPFVSIAPGKLANSLAALSLAFFVPALMSMAFPKPVMAGGVALVLCIGGLFLGSFANLPYFAVCAVVQSTLLLATIYSLARRWIVLDDLRVPLLALLMAMVILFSPWLVAIAISAY